MSERDPAWTSAQALNLTSSFTWRNPEAALTFTADNRLVIADNLASVLRDPVGANRDAFLTVTLTAGNLYHFFALTSDFTRAPELAIFDSQGYRLLSIDGDDLFPGNDARNADSLVMFAPETTGTYYINVSYQTFPFATGFYLEAWEDIGADYRNPSGPAPTTVSLSPATQSVVEGDSGTTRFTYTVTRSGDLSLAQSVAWSVAGSGANPANGADFVGGSAPSGVVTFAAGQDTATITVDVQGDETVEQTETFTVRLSDPVFGLRIGTGTATGTIVTDDTPYTLSVTRTGITEHPDGNFALVTVTRSGDVSARWTGSWTADTVAGGADVSDFQGGVLPSGRLTLAAGQASASFFVPIGDDTVIEPEEAFTVSLWQGEASNGALLDRLSLTIVDNDTPPPPPPPPDPRRVLIETTSLVATEGTGTGGTYTFTLRAEGMTTEGFTARWLVRSVTEGESVNASDFAGGSLPSGFVAFRPGETTRTVTLTFAGDAVRENDEQFLIVAEPMLETSNVVKSSVTVTLDDDDGNRVSIAPLTPTMLEGSATVGFGPGDTAAFRVTRTLADTVQTVDWAATGLDSMDMALGAAASGRLVFAVGELSKIIEIVLGGDRLLEESRTLTVSLSAPLGGVEFGTSQASIQIQDDDANLWVTGASRVTEGQSGTSLLTFTLHREGYMAGEAFVNWAVVPDATRGQAVDAADFAGRVMPAGTAIFAAGAATTTVTIQIAGDTRSEPDEYFTFNLGYPQPAMNVAAHETPVTIVNDDPRIEAGTYSRTITEGHGGVTTMAIPLVRIGDTSGTDVVGWAVSRSLSGVPAVVQARDFVGGVLPTGSVTFSPGETMKEVVLSFVADSIAEAPEAFFRLALTTTTPGLGLSNAITGSLRDDDVTFDMQSGTVERAEGQAGTTPFTFTVTRAGLVTEAASVAWAVAGTGSAPADAADFAGGVLPSGTLSFAAGETSRTITVNVAGDRLAERAERFTVTLSTTAANQSLGDADALGIILPDDSSVAITAHQAVRTEGHPGETTPFTFHVTRTGATDAAQSVAWSVAGTGASRTSASDFVGGAPPSGIVEFAAGETRKTITVNVSGDSTRELDESFAVRLSSPTNGLLIGQAEAQGTILRDETVMAITSTTGSAAEGNGGTTPFTFTVTRSGYLDAVQTASWSVVGAGGNATSSADFAGGSTPRGTIRFEAGETTRTITVNVAGDGNVERDESFAVRLTAGSPGVAFSPSQAVATILNDDTGVGITALSASKAEGQSGTTPFTFAITRTGALDAEQSVSWATGGLGASRATAADFAGRVLPSGTVTFLAGEAQKIITLDVLGDTVVEAAEQFIIRLSAPSEGLVITTASATGLIGNDDVAPAARLTVPADWVL